MEVNCAVQVDCSDTDIVVVKFCDLVHYLLCELRYPVKFIVDVLSVLGQCGEEIDCIVPFFFLFSFLRPVLMSVREYAVEDTRASK